MRKRTKFWIGAILVAGMLLTAVWTFLKLEFAGSASYTEQDWLKYEFYTPELLKKMPRISDDYNFDFANITGPEALVFSVHFQGTTDSSEIQNYLRAKGYEPQKTCSIEAECWRSYKSNDVISIGKFMSSKEIFVDIYRSPYTDPLTDLK
ncbi:hypothetical protein N5923_02430 [Erwiniaceae bacterium BAC15a-03b]|uniref:Uncharacterized protein n=1 Tax=Winslowiella arboricola TaxID=2978220 RepID=A0A9J6PIQ5_9GAMM|nr:hypothetical protein [Winslowiella arboricola]MCU5771154.1 hypothetical protein [Winslowiella arboricola]MCU5776355.1 hypothetical protein [Winslowiella arboricola]